MKEETEIIICGDLCPTKDTKEYFENQDNDSLFNDIMPIFQNVDSFPLWEWIELWWDTTADERGSDQPTTKIPSDSSISRWAGFASGRHKRTKNGAGGRKRGERLMLWTTNGGHAIGSSMNETNPLCSDTLSKPKTLRKINKHKLNHRSRFSWKNSVASPVLRTVSILNR